MSEPDFDGTDIQAVIAPGFRLPHQTFMAASGNADAVRAAVRLLYPLVTRMSEAHAYHDKRITQAKSLGTFGVKSFQNVASNQPIRWLGLALGNRPLEDDGQSGPSARDRSFKLGLAARSYTLGDPRRPEEEGHKSTWIVGGPNNAADLFLILGSDGRDAVEHFADTVEEMCTSSGCDVFWRESGHRLDGDKEHFGFRDGISQPGLRGIVMPSRKPLTPRAIQDFGDIDHPEMAEPGKVLVWPGEVLFGYPRQDPNDYRRPLPVEAEDEFMQNGSYLVFRRLRQKVTTFDQATHVMADELRTKPGFDGKSDKWLRANLVGRWPSGAPLQGYPTEDPGDPPGSLSAFDNFVFETDTDPVTLASGENVPGVAGDPAGVVCPLHAHIRQVNPRDSGTNLGPATQTQQHRMLRRGIPYGAPIKDRTQDDGVDRGLFFVSFQRSIREQFEKLTQNWMNSPVNPVADRGHDVLLGQVPSGDRLRRAMFGKDALGPFHTVSTDSPWIVATGGGYFFCPSISALIQFSRSQIVIASNQ